MTQSLKFFTAIKICHALSQERLMHMQNLPTRVSLRCPRRVILAEACLINFRHVEELRAVVYKVLLIIAE